MSAYDYARTISYCIDRRFGTTLARDIVEDMAPRLRRDTDRARILSAARELLRIFLPETEVKEDDLPLGAGAMSRLIAYAAFEDMAPARGTIDRMPFSQRTLAVALRVFLEALVRDAPVRVPPPSALPEALPPLLARRVRDALKRPPIGEA